MELAVGIPFDAKVPRAKRRHSRDGAANEASRVHVPHFTRRRRANVRVRDERTDAQDGADATADTEITTTWTVAGNDIEKDIESHPNWSTLDVLSRENLRDFKNGSKKEGDVQLMGGDTHAPGFNALIKAGTTSYTISQIVIQRTMTVAPSYAGAVAMTNVNRIYSKAGLVEAEAIPGTIVFTMLDGQYLKRTPTITQQPNGRFQITNEWWHADTWSTTLYGAVVA